MEARRHENSCCSVLRISQDITAVSILHGSHALSEVLHDSETVHDDEGSSQEVVYLTQRQTRKYQFQHISSERRGSDGQQLSMHSIESWEMLSSPQMTVTSISMVFMAD